MKGRPAVASAALLFSLAPIPLAAPAARATGISQQVVLEHHLRPGLPVHLRHDRI
jgi:hypothetical protein